MESKETLAAALACLNKGRIGECCELPRVDGLDPTHLKF